MARRRERPRPRGGGGCGLRPGPGAAGAPLPLLWVPAVRTAGSREGQGGSWLRGAQEAEAAPRQRRSGVPCWSWGR